MRRSARRLAGAAVAAALAGGVSAVAVAGEAVRLAPGESVRVEVAVGAPAVLVVAGEPGWPWVAVVGHPGVGLRVTASSAGGEEIARAGWPATNARVERLLVEPAAAGEVRLEVALREDWRPPVGVEVTIVDLAAASPARMAAERAEVRAVAALARGAEGRAEAEAALAEAAERWQEEGAPAEAARVLLGRSGVLRLDGRPSESLAAAEAAAALYRAAGDPRGEGVAFNFAGQAQDAMGDTGEARRLFTLARDLRAAHGDPAGAAESRYNVCLAELRSGAIEPGVACVEEAAAGFRASGELSVLAVALTTAGRAADFLGEPDRAFALYEEALALGRRIRDRAGEAKALNNLAFLHAGIGEPRQALAAYEEALAIFRDVDDVHWEGRVLHNLGDTYLDLGDAHRARLLLEEALALRRRAENREGEALTLSALGRTLHRLGDYAAAEGSQRQAERILGELGKPPGRATVLLALARTLRDAGDLPAAFAAIDTAATIVDPREHPRHASHLLVERGLTRFAAGDAVAAAADLAAAVERRRAEHDPWGEAEALAALAAAERRLGRLEEAESHLAASVERIEESRLRVPGPELRATFLGRWRDVYEEWVDVLMERHAAAPGAGFDRRALAASERSRARSLLDLTADAGAELDRRLAPELRDRLRSLARRVSAKASVLQTAVGKGDAAAVAAAEREVYAAVAAFEAADAEARAADPHLAEIAAPPVADAAALGARLAADELLVEVALGGERSFLWTVDGGGRLESFVLPGRAEIEAAARRVHEAASRAGGSGEPEAVAAAARLVGWLLPPGRVPAGVRRLLVVPDGALHYVPFALLPSAAAVGEPARPLVDRFEIVHLPSASTLLLGGGRRSAAGRRIAALADPVFDAGDHRVGAAARERGGAAAAALRDGDVALDLPRLRHSRREAEAIAALAPAGEALLATDFAADRELVVSGALGGYEVLHFATHGILDAQHPELSGLVLSQVDAAGRPRDGFVRLRDVYGLDLDARLVVLSGCRTALGREVRGEGLVGLTRGFLYAGVEQVVASLWRVEDRAAAELMVRFYRALWLDGLAPAAALTRAQREVAADPRWSDPFFWSAFVIQGAPRRAADSAPAAGGA